MVDTISATPATPLKMSSFLSGIIDCVARPSTSDSPVRVVRKCSSKTDSPISIADTELILAPTDSDSTAASTSSRVVVPREASALFPASTAEAVIMIPSEHDYFESDEACDDNTISSNSIDNSIRQQFEAAFATFLYKNPAFTSMSHANLSKVRSKLLKESAKNARADAELRHQLKELRESKRRNELDLQRELLVVTRAKAAREAELRRQIWTMRQATMSMDEMMSLEMKISDASGRNINNCSPGGTGSRQAHQGYSSPSGSYYPPESSTGQYSPYQISWPPSGEGSPSFQDDVSDTKEKYANLDAEIEKIKQRISETSV